MKIGVLDIGGTMIKAGVYTDGSLTQVSETPTNSLLGGPAVLNEAIRVLASLGKFDRIGISTTGQVNTDKGTIKYANPNVPDYIGTDFRGVLSSHFGVPVYVENDVNAAATGEAVFGAATGWSDFLCLTYGTGIGGAVFLNGKLYHGSDFAAGEVGQMITHAEKAALAPESYLAGAYETYASTTALVRNAMAIDPRLSNGKLVFAAANRPDICSVIDNWINEILYGLVNIVYAFNPNLIVLGGGVMSAPFLLDKLQERLPRMLQGGHRGVELRRAALGNHAGLMGAAYLASTELS